MKADVNREGVALRPDLTYLGVDARWEVGMGTGSIGAFFDFDRTLIDVESPRLGIRYLWDRRLITMRYILKVMASNILYQRHLISDETMAKILISFYRGKPFAPFQEGAADYYREMLKPHLEPNIVARVREHQEKGHVLVLVSAGLRYLLNPVAEDVGFDHLLCTDLEIGPDGILTGRTTGPICTEVRKRDLAKALAVELGLDLKASSAYGNHQADIPLLELVGKAYAVEPTEELRKVACERGWPIVRFR
jgi:HAD superfamily hydrolase (TIGR01490 family)